MLPAPGQGALAVTVREEDATSPRRRRARCITPTTAMAVSAERAFLGALEGGCQVPVAALATVRASGALKLHGRVVALGGERAVEGSRSARATRRRDGRGASASALAERLLDDGADEILALVRRSRRPPMTEP